MSDERAEELETELYFTRITLESVKDERNDLEEQLSGCNIEREIAIEAFRESEAERLFWKAAAERALRLWDRAQDEKDELRALARRAAWKAYCYADLVLDEIGEEEEVEDDREQAQLWLKQLEEDACAPPD